MSEPMPVEYQMISDFYAGKKAERSGLPYIKHIDHGLKFLRARGFLRSGTVARAFMIHPLVQSDDDLVRAANYNALQRIEGNVVALAMEYRHIANKYLSHDFFGLSDYVNISCLEEVNEMLIADKLQNLSDLLEYNRDHPNFVDLFEYFSNWLWALMGEWSPVVLGQSYDAAQYKIKTMIGEEDE